MFKKKPGKKLCTYQLYWLTKFPPLKSFKLLKSEFQVGGRWNAQLQETSGSLSYVTTLGSSPALKALMTYLITPPPPCCQAQVWTWCEVSGVSLCVAGRSGFDPRSTHGCFGNLEPSLILDFRFTALQRCFSMLVPSWFWEKQLI